MAVTPRGHSAEGRVDVEGDPLLLAVPHQLSVVYGGGGVFGIAFGLGVAHGLAAAGIDVAGAPALGTSAGSWVASALALGVPYEAFEAMEAPNVPTRNPRALIDAGEALFGDASHPLVTASAIHLRSRRRHILDGGRYRLADLVAASSAVPGLFPPHRMDGRLYVDGGMWSATSVDAAVRADEVIVVAPIAGAVIGPVGRGAEFLLAREEERLASASPGQDDHADPAQSSDRHDGGTEPAGAVRRRTGSARKHARRRARSALGGTAPGPPPCGVSRRSASVPAARGATTSRGSYTLGGMCSRVECSTCQRPTYAGCGNHVEQVLGDVAPDERCQCTSDQDAAAPGRSRGSWLRSLRRG